MTTPAWIVGASGLLAGELARLLEDHPGLALAGVASRTRGQRLRALHPGLTRELETVALEEAAGALHRALDTGPAACFLGLPHGESAAAWRALAGILGPRAKDLRVVDLSADFRIADAARYERAYGAAHPDPEGREGFVYGLPELDRAALAGATRVAAPGCFATALQLAAVPAARAGLLAAGERLVFHGVTGSSGSGVSPKASTHHPFRNENLFAYGLTGHRHEAELEQALAACGPVPPLVFLPASGPFTRGIHLTAFLPVRPGTTREELHAHYAAGFEGEPFIEVLPVGAAPELRTVVGSNRASLGLELRGELATVLVTLDNTLKGGAGQALQNMNLLLGLDETAGLPRAGLGYV
ncbi:MAG: N-acetyl-gamma-glutamyl-phosphate reductase [Planctomycetes bacterium]|nr:N-acetyl-gamma-glutamyl-phosphate reductase [Planctomycetota bacterium]